MGSESGHTPGPWFVDQVSNARNFSVRAQRIQIARMAITKDSQYRAEGLANARLIAAAPALFDALKAILSRPNRADITAKEWSAGLAALRLASSQGGDHG